MPILEYEYVTQTLYIMLKIQEWFYPIKIDL